MKGWEWGAQREIGWVINMGDRVVVLDSGVSSTVEWDGVSWRTGVFAILQGNP